MSCGSRDNGPHREPSQSGSRPAAARDHTDPARRRARLCYAPQFVAEELLRGEGFSDIEYVLEEPSAAVLGANKGDLSLGLGANFILHIDAGKPVVILAGGHIGCYELFGTSRIHSIIIRI